MRAARRLAAAAFLAAVAAGTAACGSSSAALAPDPLKSLTAPAIAAKAIAGTEAAPGAQLTGKGVDGGQSLSFRLSLAGAKGCAGTVTESDGSFTIIETGTTVWVMPSDAYYKNAAARGAVISLAEVSGKYLEEKAGGSGLGSFGNLCQLDPLLTAFKSAAASFAKGAVSTIGGAQVLRLSDGPVSLYVTDTTAPRLVKISEPGSVVYYFSGYGARPAITPPPASKILDANQAGL